MEQTGLCLMIWRKEGEEENKEKYVLEKVNSFPQNTVGM